MAQSFDNIERYLESFGKYVVKQARTNLTKGKKNVSKELYNSLRFEVITDADGFTVQFYMADYGTFVDKGVSGNKKQQKLKYLNASSKTLVKTEQKPSLRGNHDQDALYLTYNLN